MLGVLPADQRLDGDDAGVLDVDDRLHVQAQLALADRAPQPRREREPLTGVRRLRLVERHRAATAALGLVHRVVGVLEERVRVGRVLRVQRDADRRADVEERIGDLEGLVERGGDPLARGLRGTARVLVAAGAEQEQELVAALARQHVAGPREVRDAARGLGQHRVAGLVAERVVDELEVVEVEVEERERAVGAAGAAEVAADLLLQERPVREAGEAVVVGEERDLGLGALALGDVLPRAQDRGDAAGAVVEDRVAPGDRARLAAAGLHERLEARARGVDAGHQAHEREAGVEAIGGRHDGAEPVAPEQLVLVEAEQLAALTVDELDPARVVEDDHERAGDVQVALRAIALQAQAALGEDRPAHRRSSPCAHATAIGR